MCVRASCRKYAVVPAPGQHSTRVLFCVHTPFVEDTLDSATNVFTAVVKVE